MVRIFFPTQNLRGDKLARPRTATRYAEPGGPDPGFEICPRKVKENLWANCPVTVALLESRWVLGWPASEIDVLSIGTTMESFHLPSRLFDLGLLRWRKKLLSLILVAQEQAALAQAKLLVNESLLRIDESVVPGRFKLDDPKQTRELRSMGISAARHTAHEVERRFLMAPALSYRDGVGA